MAEENVEQSRAEEQSNGDSNGEDSNGRHIGRVAAIAAASGATAYAAKKALDARSSSTQSDTPSRARAKAKAGAGGSLVTAAVSSGWDVAKDSLMPVIEDAATKAGAFVAERSPDLVRDIVVPRFIAGFERAQKSD